MVHVILSYPPCPAPVYHMSHDQEYVICISQLPSLTELISVFFTSMRTFVCNRVTWSWVYDITWVGNVPLKKETTHSSEDNQSCCTAVDEQDHPPRLWYIKNHSPRCHWTRHSQAPGILRLWSVCHIHTALSNHWCLHSQMYRILLGWEWKGEGVTLMYFTVYWDLLGKGEEVTLMHLIVYWDLLG